MSIIKITRDNLTQELLKKLITYNPDTGVITRNQLSDDMRCYFRQCDFNVWNSKAGQVMTRINVHKGRCDYKQVNLNMFNFSVIASRLIVFYMTGEWPKQHVDHENGDSTDNRWSNLRDVSCQVNLRNQKIRKNNTSGRAGVSFLNGRKKWQATASITENGKRKRLYLGVYKDFNDAVKAREEWEQKQGNFSERHTSLRKPYSAP